MEDTRLKDIFKHLEKNGFDVYFPATKIGECTSRYVVVKESTSTQTQQYSSTIHYYDVLCYVPRNNPGDLSTFVDEVVECMKGLQPMIMPTYQRTEPFYDEFVKAHMVSVMYRNYRKI